MVAEKNKDVEDEVDRRVKVSWRPRGRVLVVHVFLSFDSTALSESGKFR